MRIPTLSALSAFEAAARHESFTLAAKELCLTDSAISRQINHIESTLDIRLFVRVKQRVVPTKAGRLYSEQIRASLGAIERDTRTMAAQGSGDGRLEIAVLPTFSTEWRIPRLTSFYAEHPQIFAAALAMRARCIRAACNMKKATQARACVAFS